MHSRQPQILRNNENHEEQTRSQDFCSAKTQPFKKVWVQGWLMPLCIIKDSLFFFSNFKECFLNTRLETFGKALNKNLFL